MRATILAAALVIGCTSLASAAQLNRDNGPVLTSKALNDGQMDRVTAGAQPDRGQGIFTAVSAGGTPNFPSLGVQLAFAIGGIGQQGSIPGGLPFFGTCTAGSGACN